MACTAYNGRYLMMGFASNKVVADEKFLVPRRISLGNFKLCGVMLNYSGDDMIGMIKTGMGWNVSPTSLGARTMAGVVDLVRSGPTVAAPLRLAAAGTLRIDEESHSLIAQWK